MSPSMPLSPLWHRAAAGLALSRPPRWALSRRLSIIAGTTATVPFQTEVDTTFRAHVLAWGGPSPSRRPSHHGLGDHRLHHLSPLPATGEDGWFLSAKSGVLCGEPSPQRLSPLAGGSCASLAGVPGLGLPAASVHSRRNQLHQRGPVGLF